jgi:hypothetical protein
LVKHLVNQPPAIIKSSNHHICTFAHHQICTSSNPHINYRPRR